MNFQKTWQSHLNILLFHPTEDKVLLRSIPQGYVLPSVTIKQEIPFYDFEVIKNAITKWQGFALIAEQIKMDVNVLHYIDYQSDRSGRQIKATYLVEVNKLETPASKEIWCDLSNIKNELFVDPQQQLIIEQYQQERNNRQIPALRPSWMQFGWLNEVSVWIKEQLAQLGCEEILAIEYVKSWSISCILKIKTSDGLYFFKNCFHYSPLFCDEPRVTKELNKIYPQNIPNVIAINSQRHWMLMSGFGQPVGYKISSKTRGKIYRLLAQIQIKSISQCDRLLKLGCSDRRLHILQSQIDTLMSDEEALSQLSTSEIKQLQKLAPQLKNLCEQLASYQIPSTLVHGDLHFNNIALNDNQYIFFDWSDASISHPFFDLFPLIINESSKFWWDNLTNLWDSHQKKYLLKIYLNQWDEYLSPENLWRALNLAQPLCALHHAVSYQYIFHSLEARSKHELSSGLPYFLRALIRAMSALEN